MSKASILKMFQMERERTENNDTMDLIRKVDFSMQFSTIEAALTTLKNGGFIILADNAERENEGDLVALGAHVKPTEIHQMLKIANGLMCVPVNRQIADRLGFSMMVKHSTDPNGTPFMTTTDGTLAATGVTTGVSAYDRAATIHQIANPESVATDFNHPGHIQPLLAQDKGIRARTGHTEASVDLAYLAGAEPVAVIIEVLKEDGHMARREDLAQLAQQLKVPFITIDQIAQYMDAHHIQYARDLAAAAVD